MQTDMPECFTLNGRLTDMRHNGDSASEREDMRAIKRNRARLENGRDRRDSKATLRNGAQNWDRATYRGARIGTIRES